MAFLSARSQTLLSKGAPAICKKAVKPSQCFKCRLRHLRHWEGLTAFLRVEGAPLDNNVCERALKKAILHRRNSLYYKTPNGARAGDIFMTLNYTAELNGFAPFDYLVALLRHPRQIAANPRNWMPWNYQAALAALTSASEPPA
jgi:hypothetical protein